MDDVARCPICCWPLAKSREEGCVLGDCSYRPDRGSPEWHRIQRNRQALAIPLIVMIAVLPLPVVLPAFSVWSLAAAAVVVLFALTRRLPNRRSAVNAWDLAGAFTLIGCAAGILGEIEHMVDYLFSLSSRSQTNE